MEKVTKSFLRDMKKEKLVEYAYDLATSYASKSDESKKLYKEVQNLSVELTKVQNDFANYKTERNNATVGKNEYANLQQMYNALKDKHTAMSNDFDIYRDLYNRVSKEQIRYKVLFIACVVIIIGIVFIAI